MDKHKILISGASGYVGSKIYQDLMHTGYDVIGTYHSTKLFPELVQADITIKSELDAIIDQWSPSTIIHTAADAHTATCESDPENAHKLNVESTMHIAQIAKEKNLRVIHLSTFACFNQSASRVYPKTKIEAEKIIRELDKYVILRLSLVVGLSPNTKSKNFYNDLVEAYKTKTDFEADSSWEFEMSYLGNISKTIRTIIDNPDINQVMIPNVEVGSTSRYQLAKDLLEDREAAINETTSNRIIPLPDLDLSVFEKYGIQRGSYAESLAQMKQELKSYE